MPERGAWAALLAAPGPILADGAMGTMLFDAGLVAGEPPELWNLARPDEVRRGHRGYLAAGARLILTNTLGGTRVRLGLHGAAPRAAEVNHAAARLARLEADRAGGALVGGDLGPTGAILAPLGDLDPGEAEAAFAEQAAALLEGGADLIWIETMSALEEVQAAVAGVRRVAAGVPVIVTLSFDTRGHTMMGVSPERAAAALTGMGVAAMGANCGRGAEEIEAVIPRMRAAVPAAVLVAKANAGLPTMVGERAVYGGRPELMAAHAVRVHAAGARVIGACCGSTPAHVAAMGTALGCAPGAAPAGGGRG